MRVDVGGWPSERRALHPEVGMVMASVTQYLSQLDYLLRFFISIPRDISLVDIWGDELFVACARPRTDRFLPLVYGCPRGESRSTPKGIVLNLYSSGFGDCRPGLMDSLLDT